MRRFLLGNNETTEETEQSLEMTGDMNAEVTVEDILSEKKEAFGTLYLISLADIFEALGERSSRLHEAVQLICRRAVEKHLGGDNVVEIEQQDVYALRVSGVNAEEAWRKVVAIVDEVGVNVLGERYVRSKASPMIRIAISEVAAIHDGDDFDGEKVANALEDVRGKNHSEIFRDWEEFRAGKGKKATEEWTELKRGGHGAVNENPASRTKGANEGSFRARTTADRRRSKSLFKGQDKRRHFDRRGRGY